MDPNPPPPAPRHERGRARPVEPAVERRAAGGLTQEQRQERDRERLLRMQLEGFDGPTWRDEVRQDVWWYALQVLPKLIQTGQIFTIRALLGAITAEDLVVPAGGISRDDAEDLASEAACGAIGRFHGQLKAGRWDLTKDMTFRSWFVNLCAHRFTGPFRVWLRARDEYDPGDLDPDAEVLQDTEPGPSSVIYVVEFERFLERIPKPLTKGMICLDFAGCTDQEIADATRTSVKTVERRLARARETARTLRALEGKRDWAGEFGTGVA